MWKYIGISTRLYDTSKLREYRRMLIFVIRSTMFSKRLSRLETFMRSHPLLAELEMRYPCLYEQAPAMAVSRFDCPKPH